MPIVGAFIVPHPPIIVKEVGKGEQKKIQKTITAYVEIARRIKKLSPDIVVITTPHSVMYSNYIHISPGWGSQGSFKEFGAPEVHFEIEYDESFISRLADLAKSQGIPAGVLGEKNKTLDHGVMVPLSFILHEYKEFKLVRISISGLSALTHYRFGKCLSQICEQTDQSIVIVASGDLSHKLKSEGPYGLSPDGPVFDREITDAIKNADFLKLLRFEEGFCQSAAECGLKSFIILAGALNQTIVRPELLSYEGPFGVGYAVASFDPLGFDPNRNFDQIFEEQEQKRFVSIRKNEDSYVRLARTSLEHYIKTGKELKLSIQLTSDLTERRAGVFVSLKIEGVLRGCIGTTSPTRASIAEEIIQNAISAGTRDPRFEPVSEHELNQIVYSVDVLAPSESITKKSELNPLKYGVIVKSKGRSGLLLPNLEGINTIDHQLSIALKKAGIQENEHYLMERFEVIRHH